jgi:hypothetical protein
MEIKLFACPIGRETDIEYMQEKLAELDPIYIAVDLNEMLNNGTPRDEILELVSRYQQGGNCFLNIMMPKDNEFFYTDDWLRDLYRAWNSSSGVFWWTPSLAMEARLAIP